MKTRILKTGKGMIFQVYKGSKWHNITTTSKVSDKERRNIHKTKLIKKNREAQALHKEPNSQKGLGGGDKATITLDNRITFLIGEVSRSNFELPIGYSGQEKILIVKSFSVGNQPKVYIKTNQNNATVFTSTEEGQVLHLICDGTYWCVVNNISTAGSYDPGEWTTT